MRNLESCNEAKHNGATLSLTAASFISLSYVHFSELPCCFSTPFLTFLSLALSLSFLSSFHPFLLLFLLSCLSSSSSLLPSSALRHRVLCLSVLVSLKLANSVPPTSPAQLPHGPFWFAFLCQLYTISLRSPECLGRALTLGIRMNGEQLFTEIDTTLMGMAAVVMLPYDRMLAGATRVLAV